jgi:hypothetical protein
MGPTSTRTHVPGACMGPDTPDPPCQATAWGPTNHPTLCRMRASGPDSQNLAHPPRSG